MLGGPQFIGGWIELPQADVRGRGCERHSFLALFQRNFGCAPAAALDGYEIRYPDGRPSTYVYWDDNPGRRSITLSLSSERAEQLAKDLARAEQDKLDRE
jgi:hypothetical protein